MFKVHAVVFEEAAEREGKSRKNAQPAHISDDVAQSEVRADRHENRQQCEQTLTKGQSEEDAFLKIPDFFVNFYLYYIASKAKNSVYFALLPVIKSRKPYKSVKVTAQWRCLA